MVYGFKIKIMEKEVINEICKFIIDKCEVMNIGNFEILSEMIVNDVKSIQSKLYQPAVIRNEVAVCSNPHCDNGIVDNVYGENIYCDLCRDEQTVL